MLFLLSGAGLVLFFTGLMVAQAIKYGWSENKRFVEIYVTHVSLPCFIFLFAIWCITEAMSISFEFEMVRLGF